MKRLTGKRDGADGYWLTCEDECDNDFNCSFCERDNEALDKLGEYEDAEELGLLVRLPCKVGRMSEDYIRREDAIAVAMDYQGQGNAQAASQDIAAELSSILAADVRPVVLCENCIYLANGTCRIQFFKSDESYCSWGREMDGEG